MPRALDGHADARPVMWRV